MLEWIIAVGLMRDSQPVELDRRYPTFETCIEAGLRWEEQAEAWTTRSGIRHYTGFWMCGDGGRVDGTHFAFRREGI